MKIENYEMLEAIRARDWRAAVYCLARHFNIIGRLPPLDTFNVQRWRSLQAPRSMTLYYGRTVWRWDELSSFYTYYVDEARYSPHVALEYCDED